MFRNFVWLALVTALIVGSLQFAQTPTHAGDDGPYWEMSCNQLWYERNAIYAQRGQCFKSQRAISVFGPRCYAPFGKLNSYQSSIVRKIRSIERSKGC